MARTDLTAARLRSVLDYNHETGVFVWKDTKAKRISNGDVAGCLRPNGYLCINVDAKVHLSHRLAWLYVYGEHPAKQLDHINGDRLDNRITNLRLASMEMNAQNRRVAKGVSGLLGAFKMGRRWRASIYAGRNIHLGCFDTAEEAHAAYLAAKRKLHGGCTI